MKKITITLERNADNELFGQVEIENSLITVEGDNINQVTENIKNQIDEQVKDGLLTISSLDIEFTYSVYLVDFFTTFRALNTNEVARITGLNESLVRQYATGKKKASIKQAEKIQQAINGLGEKLAKVQLT